MNSTDNYDSLVSGPFSFIVLMYSPDLAIGLGSLVYALSKLDGCLQKEEMQVARELLTKGPNGNLAFSAFFLRESVQETVEEAYAFGMRRMVDKQAELNKQIKQRFVMTLLRVARAHKGMSPKEWAFIRRFWQEIRAI